MPMPIICHVKSSEGRLVETIYARDHCESAAGDSLCTLAASSFSHVASAALYPVDRGNVRQCFAQQNPTLQDSDAG